MEEKVKGCNTETKSGCFLVVGGKIPGGEKSGNTVGGDYWKFEYHVYVNVNGVGFYDPTFERKIEDGDIKEGTPKDYEQGELVIEYDKFEDNLYGVGVEDGKYKIFGSLNDLVTNTEVLQFWQESEGEESEGEESK